MSKNNITTDKETKKKAKEISSEIKTNEPNEATLKAFAELEKTESNPEHSKPYKNINDLMNDLIN